MLRLNEQQHERLNRFITFGLGHSEHIVSEYAGFYNKILPHKRKDNHPLTGTWPPIDEALHKDETIVCQTRLGGELKHYKRIAA